MADCASLERMCTGNGTEGSNPSLSATIYRLCRSICQFFKCQIGKSWQSVSSNLLPCVIPAAFKFSAYPARSMASGSAKINPAATLPKAPDRSRRSNSSMTNPRAALSVSPSVLKRIAMPLLPSACSRRSSPSTRSPLPSTTFCALFARRNPSSGSPAPRPPPRCVSRARFSLSRHRVTFQSADLRFPEIS